jgi:alpha-D-ribose 1-methylphosphonate 5-triphosphate synthase subunit PhnG
MDDQTNLSAFSRSHWMSVLAQAPPAELETQWRAVRQPTFAWIRKPEYGSAMIRGRASGTGALFNLGEVTVTRCSLQIDSGEIGIAYVMGRSRRHAALAALFDALLQYEIGAGESTVARRIDALARSAARRRDEIVSEALGSKVDFVMLSREGGEGA